MSAPVVAGFERFELMLTEEDARACSQPGQDAEPSVIEVLRQPYIVDQLRTIPEASIVAELREYGAWDATELADTEANWRRIVWCAACNIREEIGS